LCATLFDLGRPFACLVPSDLVNHVARRGGRERDEALHNKVSAATKISFLDPALTWVLHASGVPHDVVMAVEALEDGDVRKRWLHS